MIHLFQKVGINVGSSEIESAHWIGHHKLVSRPIIIRFLTHKIRQKVYTEKNKFKELGVLVTEDYPKEVLMRHKIFQPVLQAAYCSNGKFKANLNMDKLILDGKSFSTGDLDKLPTEIQPSNVCNIIKDGKLAFSHNIPNYPIITSAISTTVDMLSTQFNSFMLLRRPVILKKMILLILFSPRRTQ